MSIFSKRAEEPPTPEEQSATAALDAVLEETRADRANGTDHAVHGLPALTQWPTSNGRHGRDPLPVLARLLADEALAPVAWQTRPSGATADPDLLGTWVVLDIDHLPDADSNLGIRARRLIEHFAATEPASQVVTERDGLRGRTRLVSDKTVDGVAVRLAVTLPKDNPLADSTPPTEHWQAIPEEPVAATGEDPYREFIPPMFARPAAKATETTKDAA